MTFVQPRVFMEDDKHLDFFVIFASFGDQFIISWVTVLIFGVHSFKYDQIYNFLCRE